MKKTEWFVLKVGMSVLVAYYGGAMLNFFPFAADDLSIRAIGFCTLIICIVIAICTSIIIKTIKDKEDD